MTVSTSTTAFIHTSLGLVQRNSSLINFIRDFVASAKNKSSGTVTDDEIDSTLLFRFYTTIVSRTVSVSDKKFPKQYEGADYFESATISFETYVTVLREKTKLKLESMTGQDVTSVLENYFIQTKTYINELINRYEDDLRSLINKRIIGDGLVPTITRGQNA